MLKTKHCYYRFTSIFKMYVSFKYGMSFLPKIIFTVIFFQSSCENKTLIYKILEMKLSIVWLYYYVTGKDKPKPKIIPENLWCKLPDLILEKIFSYLNMEEKYYASMVCSAWYRGFYLPYSWSTFIFEDSTLTRRKFNSVSYTHLYNCISY